MKKQIALFIGIAGLLACSEKEKEGEYYRTETVVERQQAGLFDQIGNIKADKAFIPSELIKWVKNPENGFVKVRDMGEVQYTLQQVPAAVMVLNGLKKERVKAEEFNRELAEYSGMEYYWLRMEIPGYPNEIAQYGISDHSEYDARIKYLSFDMQEDITMETESGDQVPCSLYHFERTYNITPYSTFLVGFDKTLLKEGDKTFVFNDMLFNHGKIKFHWSVSDKKQLPKLELI